MKRQGQDPDSESPQRRAQPAPRRPQNREPFSLLRFLREVRGELRQVAWPKRPEVINYTMVTLSTVVILIIFIFALNYSFSKAVTWLFSS